MFCDFTLIIKFLIYLNLYWLINEKYGELISVIFINKFF